MSHEHTVVYFNMPVGYTYEDRSIIKRYRNTPDTDNTWRIPYIKVGQTTYDERQHGSPQEAIRRNRGGDKTGYPITMSTIVHITLPHKVHNIDSRIRQLIHSFVNSFDETSDENRYGTSASYNRHPEDEDESFIAAGKEFIYNITKSEIIRTRDVLQELIDNGDSAIRILSLTQRGNDTYIERLQDIYETISIPRPDKRIENKERALAFDEDDLHEPGFRKYTSYLNPVIYDYILNVKPSSVSMRDLMKHLNTVSLYKEEIIARAGDTEYSQLMDFVQKNDYILMDYYNNGMLRDMTHGMNMIDIIKKYNISL